MKLARNPTSTGWRKIDCSFWFCGRIFHSSGLEDAAFGVDVVEGACEGQIGVEMVKQGADGSERSRCSRWEKSNGKALGGRGSRLIILCPRDDRLVRDEVEASCHTTSVKSS